jgi:predicted nucleotidyltransferase
LTPFLEPLRAVQHLLTAFGGRGVIIGGIAVSLLAKPRFTADVDAVLLMELDDLPHLLEEAATQGLVPRIPDIESFARKNRVLLLRHTASGIDVDISLGLLPFESEMVERSQWVKAASLRLRLPTPEDLIILKAVAHRPKDLLDIEAIVADHPELDKERIRHWVSQFAQALDMPELWDDLQPRLK